MDKRTFPANNESLFNLYKRKRKIETDGKNWKKISKYHKVWKFATWTEKIRAASSITHTSNSKKSKS